MLKSRKLLALLLALIMVIGCMLSACTDTQPEDTTEQTGSESTTSEVTTEAQNTTTLELIKNGVPNVKVVRKDGLDTSDTSVKQAMNIRAELNKYVASSDNEVKIDIDWTKDGKHDASAIEILVGMTNYDETAQISKDLKFGDYVVQVVGNKIVVLGYTTAAMSSAATELIRMITAAAVKDETTGTYSITLSKDVLKSGTKNKTISSLPAYENGTFYSWYDPGDDCDEVIIEKTTTEAWAAYVEKLKTAGYTEYTKREIEGNSFATLYNANYTINIGYYKNNKQVRIIVEPYSADTLIGLEADNKYTVVTTSQITTIGLEYQKSDGGYSSNGMSILIRLTDGRFIVVDGGFNRQACADMLVQQIKEQSKEYSSKTGMVIAAWIVTHSHGDHNGMINSKYSTLKNNNIKVQNFLINFMSDDERNRSIAAYSGNWSSGEGGGWGSTYSAAAALGATVRVVHVGQLYYFADLVIDCLYTIESYGPAATNALNTTSLIMKMTFTDPITKKETVYLSTGDATGPGFKIAAAMFGNYLKSDIVQVAHHGYTTWGTEEGTIAAYKKASPATLLWPQGIQAYPNYVNKSYNKVLWDLSTNPNYKETLVSGSEGTITIFPIPYTVGSAIVTTK